jgi:hypothetical protein
MENGMETTIKNQNIEATVKVVEEPELLFTRPELLLHPNLPKPMHNLAPRTLMKAKEWNEIRREAYARNNYHCWACGRYTAFNTELNKFDNDEGTTLDAHEFYRIDYVNKTVELVEIVALCKLCHDYVHSGRLNAMYEKGEKDEEDCWLVYTNGDSVLIDAGLIPINVVDDKTYQDEWGEWKLLFNGGEYRSKFKDYWDWFKYYNIK